MVTGVLTHAANTSTELRFIIAGFVFSALQLFSPLNLDMSFDSGAKNYELHVATCIRISLIAEP